MRIGVPRQHSPGERRVAVTPDVAGKLVEHGHVLQVETGAGLAAGHDDDAYREVGGEIVDEAAAWSADLAVTIDRPPPTVSLGSGLLGLLRPLDDPEGVEELAGTGVTAFAFEAMPRTTRAQAVDALSSQATAAGYQAVLEGAAISGRFFPMLTTAAGTIPPARVVVLGAGVAGLQAIATARRLGAVVSAFDVRAAAAEQVRSLGATFIEAEMEAQDASGSGGYAREVADEEEQRILAALAPHVARADVVVTTAAIPGRRAPLLVTAEMVAGMRRGSVVVDLSAATGGNCEVTVPGETVEHAGVTIVGNVDLVSRKATDASHMYARNVANFVALVSGEDGSFRPDWEDEIVSSSCVTREGAVVHPRVLEALGGSR